MPYTGTEIFKHAIELLDELSDSGAVVDAQIGEYKHRAPGLLDMWQHEDKNLEATAEILRVPVRCLYGGMGVYEHVADDKTYEAYGTARAAVFTVSDQADVYIENYVSGAWADAEGYYSADGGEEAAFTGLISIAALSVPATYKCTLTPPESTGTAAGDKTRIRFSGSYYYLFSDFALFEAAYQSCTRVPEYGEYVTHAMPADFDSAEQIITESPSAGLAHRWESGRLLVRHDFGGVIKVRYRPNPTKITDLAQTLEVSERSATAAAYYLAMHFAISDQNEALAALCTSKYQEIRGGIPRKPLAPTRIRNVWW